MWKIRTGALIILLLGIFVGYFVYTSEPKLESLKAIPAPAIFANFPFKLGLDLSGGTHLVFKADLSGVKSSDVSDSMSSLRDVIERRVNLFGVAEPIVQVEEASLGSSREQRLIVDLPGVTEIDQAVAMIGQTPLLEFKTESADGKEYVSTPLTGRFLERAILEFDQNTREPIVSLQFNKEGTDLFSQITKENVGKTVAIFLDGAPISTPVVREEISGGKAQISGNFTPAEGKTLVGRLNSGALPVPISLISTQTIGPSLGVATITAGVKAAMIGLLFVALFLILWYRLPGLIAIFALFIYVSIMLALFKLIPVTLTAASIAGFIISIGIAVDANVLIFERLKEELKSGKNIKESMQNGFSRAWFSIRDSNTSTLITALILFWFGTSLIQGFALVLGMGVLASMLSAIIISRIFLFALNVRSESKVAKFLFSSGLSK